MNSLELVVNRGKRKPRSRSCSTRLRNRRNGFPQWRKRLRAKSGNQKNCSRPERCLRPVKPKEFATANSFFFRCLYGVSKHSIDLGGAGDVPKSGRAKFDSDSS